MMLLKFCACLVVHINTVNVLNNFPHFRSISVLQNIDLLISNSPATLHYDVKSLNKLNKYLQTFSSSIISYLCRIDA